MPTDPPTTEVTYEAEAWVGGYWEAGYWDKHLPTVEAAQEAVRHHRELAEEIGEPPVPYRIRKVTREVIEVIGGLQIGEQNAH